MSVQTPIRVFSPFRNRVVNATPGEAKILRQVKRVSDFYTTTAAERGRVQQREWKLKSKASLLGELEMLDTTVAGIASWCHGSRRHPDPIGAVEQMQAYDLVKLSKRLKQYPKLQAYVGAVGQLRKMVISFFREKV